MNCLEFKKLALSDPNSRERSFLEHSAQCPACLKYVGSIRQMDSDLGNSLDVDVPSDLMARLQLNQELLEDQSHNVVSLQPVKRYAIAASVALALFVGGFMASNQIGLNGQISQDYESMVAGVVNHMEHEGLTPVWNSGRANETANALLASYDSEIKLRFLDNLQFSRICPMGQYKGLHASLETSEGQVTFVYIKGDSVGELINASYQGYLTRVKPIRGGNLIILSKTNKALQQADKQLEEAIYWEI